MKNRKKQVRAMQTLLEHYKRQERGKDGIFTDEINDLFLPLCMAVKFKCKDCVWTIERGEGGCKKDLQGHAIMCFTLNHIKCLPTSLLKRWRKLNITLLTKWIAKYKGDGENL